jgi:hypothetical protein
MKQIPLYYSRLLALCVAGSVVSGCGALSKKNSDKNDSGSQQQASIDTVIEGEPTVENDKAKINYKSNQPNAKFLCKIDVHSVDKENLSGAWSMCAPEGAQVDVLEGQLVTFSVKSVDAAGHEDETPATKVLSGKASTDRRSKVQPQGEIKTLITNKVKIEGKVTENTQILTFGTNSSTPNDQVVYQCKVGDAKEYVACPDGDRYQFTNLQNGKTYSLSVRAVIQETQAILPADSITFAADFSGRYSSTIDDLREVDIAGFYKFRIPVDMHLTQYSTYANYSAGLTDVYRVAQKEDPYYLGLYPGSVFANNGCSMYDTSDVAIRSPAGNVMRYCRGSYDDARFRDVFGFRFANTHVETATDAEAIHKTGKHERLLIQVFDDQFEFSITRSRFNDLCAKKLEWGKVYGQQNLFNGYWFDEQAKGNMWVCTITLSGLGDTAGVWKVGGFVYVDGGQKVDWGCNCSIPNTRAVEVVYMEKVTGSNAFDWEFARHFQEYMMSSLGKSNPF